MTARTKIDVHVGTLSMEFSDNLVQFNIFEVMKHPTKDHSLFSLDIIDELEEAETDSNNLEEADTTFNNQKEAEIDSRSQSKAEADSGNPECKQIEVESDSGQPIPHSDRVGQPIPRSTIKFSPLHSPPTELKSLLDHLKYSYLNDHQHFPVIIANNLHWERHLTILDVVKKEVTKLLAARIIYPVLDNQWISPIQVVSKKFGMTVTHKDHIPLPFIDQVLERLAGKSHYCFLDGFFGYMQIHIALMDQYKTTFTCPFGTFAYTLCHSACATLRVRSKDDCMEVFMDDFTVYAKSFEACLENCLEC
ncbi:hypothetical protein CR513_07333, partial [Mucuna pruriens]